MQPPPRRRPARPQTPGARAPDDAATATLLDVTAGRNRRALCDPFRRPLGPEKSVHHDGKSGGSKTGEQTPARRPFSRKQSGGSWHPIEDADHRRHATVQPGSRDVDHDVKFNQRLNPFRTIHFSKSIDSKLLTNRIGAPLGRWDRRPHRSGKPQSRPSGRSSSVPAAPYSSASGNGSARRPCGRPRRRF